VTPQAGLYTAVVAGFLISALGGSRTQIGGPTGAFVVIVAGIVARFRDERAGHGDCDGRNPIALDGADRFGRGGEVHSADGCDRVYQRHRHPDCIDADQGLLRAEDGAVPSEFLPRMKVLAAAAETVNWPALGLGAERWRFSCCCPG